MSAIRSSVTITNPNGFHFRPHVKFTKLAKTFDANIRVRGSPEAPWIDAKSIAKVMKLMLPKGRVLELEADGVAAQHAIDALRSLVERDFDEAAAES
ncbi:MAG TPA: HPr family phosphocarrier protein [Dongiaceae bacterium]